MKRLSLILIAAFAAMMVKANDLNIFASQLKAAAATDANTVEIEYMLNAEATALEVQFYASDQVIATVAITDDALMTKGVHTATIDLTAVPAGTYTWGIKATAEPREDAELVAELDYYGVQDVAVDNNFESDYFGSVYVANALAGNNWDKDLTKAQEIGIYIHRADLSLVNSKDDDGEYAYSGNVDWTEKDTGTGAQNRYRCSQLQIDAEGNVFIADRASAGGVYMMNPAKPEDDFAKVLYDKENYSKISAFTVDGVGKDQVLYVLDDLDGVRRYNIGNGERPNTEKAEDLIYIWDTWTYKWPARDMKMSNDGKGGFWFYQTNTIADRSRLWHLNPKKVNEEKGGEASRDYAIEKYEEDGVDFPITTTRGAGNINYDYTQLAIFGDNTIYLYDISWDEETNTPILKNSEIEFPELKYESSYADGLSFDRAGNIYVCTSYYEAVWVFAMPKADNSFVTLAKTENTITSTSTAAVQNVESTKVVLKGVYSITGKYMGESTRNLPAGMYIVNGKKVVK